MFRCVVFGVFSLLGVGCNIFVVFWFGSGFVLVLFLVLLCCDVCCFVVVLWREACLFCVVQCLVFWLIFCMALCGCVLVRFVFVRCGVFVVFSFLDCVQ